VLQADRRPDPRRPDRAVAQFAGPTVAAPGQAAVICADDRVLAGGWLAA
jgi:hypothetical protein